MTVGELMEKLKEYPQNAEVYTVDNYYGDSLFRQLDRIKGA